MQIKLTEKLINIPLNQDLVLITYLNQIFIFQAPLQLNPLQLINQIMSRTKFLNSGIALYKQIEKIKKEEKVKAKYCPQCIPIRSIPFLSKSDLTK